MSSTAITETKPARPAVEMFSVKVDGKPVTVPRLSPDHTGKLVPTTMIQACFEAGTMVPHYCYHPKLAIAGNCRMCLVEYGMPALGPDSKPITNPDGTLKISKSPRPAIACATPILPGMEIYCSTPSVKAIREGVLESLLINHPLDCPICDQAGECKLQEYSVDYGQSASRFVETRVHKPKAVDLGPRIMLDAERCILCSRCIRFTRDVAGDDVLGIVNRGSYNTIATFPGTAFDNNYTLNTVDLCPVGALSSKDFRFQMRVWFLKETKSICTSCATGCNIVIGSREEKIYRYTPRENDAVNGSWMCDHGRLNYKWIDSALRLTDVLRKAGDSGCEKTTWAVALNEIAERLKTIPPGSAAIIASARQTNEELWLLKKIATKIGMLTDTISHIGESDQVLLSEDRTPNQTGARLTGICIMDAGIKIPLIAEGIRSGKIRTLIVFGEDVTKYGIEPELLLKLETLIVSDILPSETTMRARYLLPGCAHVEKRGTFTNTKGRVQKFMKAIEPKGDSRAEWKFLAELAARLTGERELTTIESLFNAMAADVPAFNGRTWAGLGDTGVSVTRGCRLISND